MNAVTKHGRLPKYAVFVLDTDILEYLGYSKFGASTLLGKWLEWVVQQVGAIVVERNQQLPKKAVNNVFIYWVLAPGHVNFLAEQKIARAKMNNCLESVIKLHQNMRVMQLVQHWDQNDMNLVNPRTGKYMDDGLSAIWNSIDAGIKFNVEKRELYLARVKVGNHNSQQARNTQQVVPE